MNFALVGNQNSGKTTLFNALTGANQHVGAILSHSLDALRSAGSTESDLHSIYAAGSHSLCGGDSVFHLVQYNNGNNNRVCESGQYIHRINLLVL